jgi:UDP-glucose 4-epimerase
MTHALITGGAGFIGSHLAEKLLSIGDHVTIIDNLSTGRFENIAHLENDPRFRYAIEDIRHAGVIDRLVSDCDVVYHLAAAVGVFAIVHSPIDTLEVNVGGTEIVLKTARRYRKKVLIASTSEVYGKGVKVPFSEDDDRVLGPTTRSRWSYAASKELDEFLGLAYHKAVGLPVTIVRLFNTVGPRQIGSYGMVIPRFVTWALSGQSIEVYGDGQQSRAFANVRDVVQAISLLGHNSHTDGQIFNVGNNEEITILALAEKVKQLTGSTSEIVLIPYEKAYEVGFEDMRRRVPDISRIKAAIGWEPETPLDETIRQVIQFQQAQA